MNHYNRVQQSQDTRQRYTASADNYRLVQIANPSNTGSSFSGHATQRQVRWLIVSLMIVMLAIVGVTNTQAQELDPMIEQDWSHYTFGLGFNAMHNGDFGLAIEYLSKSIDEDPEYASAYAMRATAYYMMGAYSPALEDFDVAIGLSHDYSSAYHWRGKTYLAMGDYDLALTNIRAAIQIDPGYVEAYQTLSAVYLAQGNYMMAAGRFAQYLMRMEMRV